MRQKVLIIIGLLIFCSSCNNTVNNATTNKTDSTKVQTSAPANSLPDISGYYRLPETSCNIALTITKEKSGYKYFFKGDHLDLEGIALVSLEEKECYVTFDGPIGNTPPKTVSGLFEGKTLTIQNEGNASNQYHYFADCDEKYLVFTKN